MLGEPGSQICFHMLNRHFSHLPQGLRLNAWGSLIRLKVIGQWGFQFIQLNHITFKYALQFFSLYVSVNFRFIPKQLLLPLANHASQALVPICSFVPLPIGHSVSLCMSSYLQNPSVEQDSLKFHDPSASANQMLETKVCTSTKDPHSRRREKDS